MALVGREIDGNGNVYAVLDDGRRLKVIGIGNPDNEGGGINPVLEEFAPDVEDPDLSAIRPELRPTNWIPGWWGRHSISAKFPSLPDMPNLGWVVIAAAALLVAAAAVRGR